MSYRIQCPGCQSVLQTKNDPAGRRLRCPKCQKEFAAHGIRIPDDGIKAMAATKKDPPDAESGPKPASSKGKVLPPPDPKAIAATRQEAPDPAATGPDVRGGARTLIEGQSPPERSEGYGLKARGGHEEPVGGLDRIGRFQLRAALGQGSFGRVYRAYDPQLDRQVALKVPRFAANHPEQAERFLQEAKAAARLRHPNIVAVYDSGKSGNDYFIASEFVEGMPLSARIAEHPPHPRQAARWVRDLAKALSYAHREGIIHRDIKPANIMIDNNGRAQLMDFGLAKRVGEDAASAGSADLPTDAGQTAEGAILGTPAYMAPEQARGETKAVGRHSDQYSLGAVLYEALTGKPPYQGTVRYVLAKAGDPDTEPEKPRSINPKVSEELEAVCLKAMAKNPARRYEDAEEFADDLGRWLRNEPVDALPLSRRQEIVRWVKANPGLVLTSAGLLLGVILVVGISVAFFSFRSHVSEAEKLRLAQEEEAKRKQEQEQAANWATEGKLERTDGLRLCEAGEVGPGMVHLAKAFANGVKSKDAALEEGAARDLLDWAKKVKDVPVVEPVPRQLWDASAARLLGVSAVKDKKPADGAAPPKKEEADPRWALTSVRLLGLSLPHPQGAKFAAFRGSSVQLITNLRLWNAETGRPEGLPPKLPAGEEPVAYTPDGNRMLTTSPGGNHTLRDTATGEPVGKPFLDNRGGAVLSPNGRIAVLGVRGLGMIWDAVEGRRITKLEEKDWHLGGVAFSPDGGSFFAMTVYRGNQERAEGRLFDGQTGEPRAGKFEFHHAHRIPTHLALAADGKTLLTLAEHPEIWLWNVSAGPASRPTAKLVPPAFEPPRFATFSPDGQAVASLHPKGALLWDVGTAKPLGEILEHPWPGGAAFSPDGKRLVTWGNNQAMVWDVAAGRRLGPPLETTDYIQHAGFSPDGRLLFTLSPREVRVWVASLSDEERLRGVELWVHLLTGQESGPTGTVKKVIPDAWKKQKLEFEMLIGLMTTEAK